uniref:C-type lectin domain-containing protein n=1 Tax=Panagrolaimus sp. PS1159 TaxID=55785 RepID=A0AC35FZL0_9BILA
MINGLLDSKAKENFHESTMSDFWIGLNKLEILGNWSWTGSSPFDFKDWAPSEPSNLSCASMNLDKGNCNWSAAEINCVNQSGHLASFHTYEEANFLSFADSGFPSGIWVGLYTINNGITWIWSDGSPADYLPWAYNHPVKGENCAYIGEKQLYTFTCGYITYSICKRPAF